MCMRDRLVGPMRVCDGECFGCVCVCVCVCE